MHNLLHHLATHEAITAAFIGAVFGSLSSFLLILLHDFLRSLKERQTIHLNSMVKLETELQIDAEVLYDNLYMIPQFMESLTQLRPFLHTLDTFTINTDHFQAIHSLTLKNHLLAYQSHTRKLNKDIAALCDNYRRLRDGYVSGTDKEKQIFVANAPQFINWLKELDAALTVHLEELNTLTAEDRLRIRKDTSWLRKAKLRLLRRAELAQEEIDLETKQVAKERDKSAEEDRDRIEKIKQARNDS
jgi:hypothetical protein